MAINGTIVQTGRDSNFGATSLTVDGSSGDTWDTPTSGNILVGLWTLNGDGSNDHTPTWPAGWTVIQSHHPSASYANMYSLAWKVSDGTETSIQVTWGNNGINGELLGISEWDATDLDTSVVDDSNEVADTGGSVTSRSTGSATNTTADALALYFGTVYQHTDWAATSWDSGTEQVEDGVGGTPGWRISSEVLSATGAQSATMSTTDTGNRANGAIAIFAGSVAGAPTRKRIFRTTHGFQ